MAIDRVIGKVGRAFFFVQAHQQQRVLQDVCFLHRLEADFQLRHARRDAPRVRHRAREGQRRGDRVGDVAGAIEAGAGRGRVQSNGEQVGR